MCGVVLDTDKGLVLAPRGDSNLFDEMNITISGISDVKASVVFLHYTDNLMVLQYNPVLITGEVRAINLGTSNHQPGDKVYYAALDPHNKHIVETVIEVVCDQTITRARKAPNFYPFFSEVIQVQSPLSQRLAFGALLD